MHDYRASCSLSPTPYAIQLVDLAYPCSGWFPVPTSRRRSVQGAGRRQRRNTHTRLPPRKLPAVCSAASRVSRKGWNQPKASRFCKGA